MDENVQPRNKNRRVIIMTDRETRTVILSAKNVLDIINEIGIHVFMDGLIKEVRSAFIDYKNGKITSHPRTEGSGYLWEDGRTIEVMHASNNDACFKIVNYHPDNVRKGYPTVMGACVYLDCDTGFPKMISDMTILTALRTGAASAVATQTLGRKDSERLGIIGAGFQGEANLHAISRVMENLQEVYVADTNEETADLFSQRMKKFCNSNIERSDIETTVRKSDVIVTCTYGNKVVVRDGWVREGVHINAVGADTRGKQELATELLIKSKVVVDVFSQAESEGEVNMHIRRGRYHRDDIYADLGEILLYEDGLTGKLKGKKGRKDDREITIFDSTGVAFEDLAAMRILYKHLGEHHGEHVNFIYFPPTPRTLYSSFTAKGVW